MSFLFDDLAGAYAWLNGQVNYEKQLGQIAYNDKSFELEGFRRRLRALGDPQRGLRTIHIAGTRGKGSAALALEALLQGAGLRTAVYTSPHLREYRERIRVNGEILDGAAFTRLLRRVAEAAEGGGDEKTAGEAGERAFKTVFENLTALYFLAARESGADWAIVETGLGGRLDATNVVDPGPVLLTRIGLEHTHLLGNTIREIAGEKAAILKPGGWAVAAAQGEDGEAEAVFRARAAATGTRLDWAADLCPLRRLEPHKGGMRVEFGRREIDYDYDYELRARENTYHEKTIKLNLGLYGEFQGENIQNALAMLSRLEDEGLVAPLGEAAMARTLEGLRIPGRMEKVCDSPELYADGGHCPTAAAALARTMRGHFGEEPAGLLVGMMQEKDQEGFFHALTAWPHWAWVGVYRVESPRAMAAEELAEIAERHFSNIRMYHNLEQALEFMAHESEKVDRVVATGSLYSIARLQEWGSHHGSGSPPAKITAEAEQVANHRNP